MKQIVCLSTSPWYPIPTRKQQVMQRIADAKVLYFDPPVTWLAPLRDAAAREKLRQYKKQPVQAKENVLVFSLPPVLPFFNKFRWINRLNQRKTARFVKRKMRENGFENPVLWTYSPSSCDAVSHIPHRAVVYDCVDRHSAYGGLMNPAVVDEMELCLAKQANRVFATATRLAERLQTVNERTTCLPNGANYARFSQAAQPQPTPPELSVLPGPIIGFVGALQACIEYEFVRYAAENRPAWSFVFIGGEKPGVDLSALRCLKNVHFLGLKPNEQLPRYLSHFDVCLNLFDASDLSKDVSPLKFYEYLATGKPIVSTPQPEQVLAYRGLIEIADSREAFVEACERALSDQGQERKALRMAEGAKCSWDSRVAQMCRILQQDGIF